MSLYLGENLISGQATLVGESRNIGQIISSTIPLTDAGLHLLDGSLIQGGGIYSAFVDYIADLYDNTISSWGTYIQPTNPSGITSSSGFSNPLNAFDNSSSTYASCGTTTDYIEWDLGETLKVSGFNATIQWVSGSASSCNISIYSVDGNNNETLIANGSGVPQGASGTSSAQFSAIEVSKLRFKGIPNDGGQTLSTSTPSRIVQINIIAQREIKPVFCTESEWQTAVTTYGVCGKFVYDATANTVRLPKVTGIIEGTTDVTALGDLVEAGLPNITGSFQIGSGNAIASYSQTGAFYGTDSSTNDRFGGGSTSGTYRTTNIDASRSSSIYGNSSTVQPQTIKAFYYIVIATSTKTDIQVDIDEVVTDLNGKADTDLTNCTDVANIKMAHNAMPSDTYVNLTLGASGTSYTVPADGYVKVSGVSTSSDAGRGWVYLESNNYFAVEGHGNQDVGVSIILPILKDTNFSLQYNSVNINHFRFYYAQGSESEAQ